MDNLVMDALLLEQLKKAHEQSNSQGKPIFSKPTVSGINGLTIDYTKHPLTAEMSHAFETVSQQCDVLAKLQAMMGGCTVNQSEGRQALHTLLRAQSSMRSESLLPLLQDVAAERRKMYQWAEQLRLGQYIGNSGQVIDHIVHLGIGGSHLGPKLAYEALVGSSIKQGVVKVTFVSSIDACVLDDVLENSNPHKTLFLVVSKSFATQETLFNANRARAWLQEALGSEVDQHLWAVSAQIEKACVWGVSKEHVLPLWPWVGGRFSIWSSANVTLAIGLGQEAFEAFLQGASDVDQHALGGQILDNAPLLSALLDVWYNVALGCSVQAVIPYSYRLRSLPDYLQQLWMESLGKNLDKHGRDLTHRAGSVLFGGIGTESQHGFFQMLAQGGHRIPLDIIVTLEGVGRSEAQRWLLAHGLGQAATLGVGRKHSGAPQEPCVKLGFEQPVTIWVLETLSPYVLGAMLACFEHRVVFQSMIYDINAFDQWGVEIGKKLATVLYDSLGEQVDRSMLGEYVSANVLDVIAKAMAGENKA